MSDTNKAYIKTAVICVIACVLLYLYANLSQWRGHEIDTTGMSLEQIALLERWME